MVRHLVIAEMLQLAIPYQLLSQKNPGSRDCSIATGADSKIARQEQGETTWDPLNASELAPQLGERLDPKPNCVGQVPTAR